MGFFDKLASIASSACDYQARRFENAAKWGRVGDRRLNESQRQMARDKAAEFRNMSDRLRPDDY